MKDMRRSVSTTREMDERIIRLRKTDKYARCSISEIIRKMVEKGLEQEECDRSPERPTDRPA